MADEHDDEQSEELLSLPADLPGQPTEATLELSPEELAFQEERRTTLGGTDTAAHLGFSTYRNAWDVAAEKRSIIEPWGGNERTELGRLLEEPIAREYARRTGQQLRRCGLVRDKQYPFLGGHPDRLVVGERKGIEIKTVDFGFEKWSKPGEPLKVPRDYYVQCQKYMMVTDRDTWDLVAMFGLQRIRWYTLVRSEPVIRAMREKDVAFWEKYVLGPDLPPIEGRRAGAWIRERFHEPKSETYVIANEEQSAAIARWLEAKGERDRWKKDEENLKLAVQQAIGDAEGIVSGDVTLTWKKNRDSTAQVTDFQALLLHYADKYEFNIEADDIVQFTQTVITKQGPRVLREKGRK